MNLKVYFVIIIAWFLTAFAYGQWQYHMGWNVGRQNLVQQQKAKAQAQLAKQTTRQQANDSKAAAADDEGKAKTVTITQEVIKYIQKPNKSVCLFDDERVAIKREAIENANKIPGYDKD